MRALASLLVSASFLLGCAPRGTVGASAPVQGAVPARWQEIPVAPLVWTPPLISQYADTLRPGVVVFWVPDNSLPLASIQWSWQEGRAGLDPRASASAQILGDLLRRGGAGELSPSALDDTLEFLAARIGVSVGLVRSNASVSGLSRDLPTLVDLLTTMLTRPRLDPARLEVLKAEMAQAVAHRFDTPAQTQGPTWERVSYGPGDWTALLDSASLAAVTRESVREARAGRFAGRNVRIAVAGRFDRAQVRRLLLEQMDRLDAEAAREKPKVRLDSLAPVQPQAPVGVYVYDIPATQVQIRLGTRFVRRDHPDYYPLMLASYVLGGGGFGSRLVDRVRSSEGLAYHVSSWAGSDYDREATLGVLLQTKTPSAGRALFLVHQEIERLADSGFRPGELERARAGLSASIPSLFDTPENTADLLLQSAIWGRPDNHFRRYQKALDSIPDSTVLQVFRRWFRPESLRVVISGPLDSLAKPFADGSPPLTRWGPVHRLQAADLLRRTPLDFEKR